MLRHWSAQHRSTGGQNSEISTNSPKAIPSSATSITPNSQRMSQGSHTSSRARPGAIHETSLVEVFLKSLKSRILSQIRIPLWVDPDAVQHGPHHSLVTRLSSFGRVAQATSPRAIKLIAEKDLEFLACGILCQTCVPFRVQDNAMCHGPGHIRVALFALNCYAAEIARLGAIAFSAVVQKALKLLEARAGRQTRVP